jgi:23S rRNA pseudouridine2605 synthase
MSMKDRNAIPPDAVAPSPLQGAFPLQVAGVKGRMTDDAPETPPETPSDPALPGAPPAKSGDRIAKVLARAGLASRRDAEKLIAAGRIAVNGRVIDSPALDIGPKDRVTLDGQPIPDAEPPRLWLYHKPPGLVTTEKDEEGRATVFDNLPDDLPRVMSVGRLDITSEGLLLLTNDGEIKRRLELPSTGWLRKYRVRVNGTPDDASLAPLRQGIVVDGVAYQPMQVTLDRQQGANAWLTVGLREGKNREVRRAMEAVGLTVNRLIRVSYGPFRLEEIEPGQVVEVRPKVLRDQLGLAAPEPGGSARTVRTVRASAPRAGSGSAPAKGAFAPKEGKAGWLANPSSSGRPRAGGKPGAGPRRSLDAAPAGAGGEGYKGSKTSGTRGAARPPSAGFGSKSAGTTGKPRAAGTRFAAPVGKGTPARPKPAWGERKSEGEGAGTSELRVRKPRNPKSTEGGSAGSDGGGSARPARPPRQGSGTTWADRKVRSEGVGP